MEKNDFWEILLGDLDGVNLNTRHAGREMQARVSHSDLEN